MTLQDRLVTDSTRPALILLQEDYRRLAALANAARMTMPKIAEELAEEIARAQIVARHESTHAAVYMNSIVTFRDDVTGFVREVTLVYPHDADITSGKVSVMTPIGTALIGVVAGDSITWETPAGETRQLTVLAVRSTRKA
jgi:regulator of nucleoside diphosphate kinase